ncbi:MAG: hypothetical protein L3J84_08605 [Gammaproteobacteria bacterium]|nr:hypothetical protein [Gammaproteobacteria bacterium]
MLGTDKDVPVLEWPEDCNVQECNEVTEKIFQIFHENCHLDIAYEDVCLFFSPDPPKSANSYDWIRGQCDESLVLDKITWGNQGVAYVCCQRQFFEKLISVFLSMQSTTLAILAAERSASDCSFEQQAPRLIESFMLNQDGGFGDQYAGLFFDMGILQDIHVRTKLGCCDKTT